MGFETQESLLTSSQETSVIVKAFSKRKPESLTEAKAKKSDVSFQLNHPPVSLLITILSFLALIFPLIDVVKAIRPRLARDIHNDSPIYLLTGQLII
ncbi:MAG: hypothetical protein EOP45_19940 [Sphingobacteriaceae bacterium]|nr:MAG: hypothetical protein EOP45_19940 [Sphingobacteriaceae bacterium]